MLLVLICSLAGCYTRFLAPIRDSDSQGLQGSLQESMDDEAVQPNQDYLANPSIPASMMQNYDWQFFYSSPWWRDNLDYSPYGSASSPDALEQRSFDRRTPAGTSDDRYAPAAVAAPPAHLAKPAEGDKPSTGSEGSQDNRRDFDRRSQTEEKKESSDKRSRESRQP